MKSFPKLKKYWNALIKKEKQMDEEALARYRMKEGGRERKDK